MLSADQIDALGMKAEQLMDPVIDLLVEDIARRVAEAGQLTGTAAYQVWRAQNLGLSQKEIKKKVQKLLKVSQKELEQLFSQAAEVGYDFDLSNLPTDAAVPFAANDSLQQIVSATVELAQEDLTNIVQTIGFVGSDGKARSLTKAYQHACDTAFLQVSNGSADYMSAIRNATKNLADKGIRYIDYESGVHTSMEAAVRRNIMGGLGLMQEKISQDNHDSLGCDGWELSAHAGSAPDHEPYQGKQFTDDEYKRLNSRLLRRIGTLNCGHAAFPIILGVNAPQFTPEQLEEFRKSNERGVTYEGKHYTLYEASQRQRKLERSIRKQKRRILTDESLGDKDKLQIDQIKLVRYRDEYSRFSKAAGLTTQFNRMETAGFDWKKGKAAEAVANDPFKNPPKDLEKLSGKIDKALNRYSKRASKWSGTTVIMSREKMPNANGRKEWNCDISLRETAEFKTVVHEHLHARSVSYFDSKTYLKHQNVEEGTVELYAQEICKQNGVKFRGAYAEKVKPLHIINNILRNGDRYTFAKQLFDIPLPERYNWLREQANQLISTGKLSKKTVKGLNDAVEFFRPIEGVG